MKKIYRNLSSEYICVTGCQRSGTTLMMLILDAHPNVVGKDESELRDRVHPGIFTLLFNYIRGKKTCRKLPTQTGGLEEITTFYPNSEIIWMCRDPVYVVSSMKSLRLDKWKGNWLSNHSSTELKQLSRLFDEIDTLNPTSEVELGAYIWKYNYKAFQLFKKHHKNVTIVKYEDLVKRAKETVKKVTKKIRIPFDNKMLNFKNLEYNEDRRLAGNTSASCQIENRNYQDNLSKEDIKTIYNICGKKANKIGYEL